MSVPLFELFGDNPAAGSVELLHIEDIAERSSRYSWEIPPHAHGRLFQLMILFAGGGSVILDGAEVEIAPPAAIVIPAGVIHSCRFFPGTAGYVMTALEAGLIDAGRNSAKPELEALLAKPRIADLGSSALAVERLERMLAELVIEFAHRLSGRDLMFLWLANSVLLLVHRQLESASLGDAKLAKRSALLARFKAIVEQNYHRHLRVGRYAELLGVTESKLNRLCFELTGNTALGLVRERILLEAKRRLIYVAIPVNELAYELGFDDPSYFCRFFKRMTGLSPAQFRSKCGA